MASITVDTDTTPSYIKLWHANTILDQKRLLMFNYVYCLTRLWVGEITVCWLVLTRTTPSHIQCCGCLTTLPWQLLVTCIPSCNPNKSFIPQNGKQYVGQRKKPDKGWDAFMIEVTTWSHMIHCSSHDIHRWDSHHLMVHYLKSPLKWILYQTHFHSQTVMGLNVEGP